MEYEVGDVVRFEVAIGDRVRVREGRVVEVGRGLVHVNTGGPVWHTWHVAPERVLEKVS